MIQSFADTEDIYHGNNTKHARKTLPVHLHDKAQKKFDIIDAAQNVTDLIRPPSNHLEPLKGNLKGLYSIRINDQWRIVFRWTDSGAEEVRIMDYH